MGEKRLSLKRYVDKAFWLLLCAVIAFAAEELKSIGDNVSSLNEKMATVIERLSNQDHQNDLFEHRLESLEKSLSKEP